MVNPKVDSVVIGSGIADKSGFERKFQEAIERLYTRFNPLLKDQRLAQVLVAGSMGLISLTLIVLGFFPDAKDFQEMGYTLFAIPIIFAILANENVAVGLKVGAISFPLWMVGIVMRIHGKIIKGDLSDIWVESIALPLLFFMFSALIGQLLLWERKLLQRYKNAALQLAARNEMLQRYHSDLIRTLTRAIDAKDSYTRGHSERVGCLSLALAKTMGVPPEEQRNIFYAGTLHDIGKIGVSDQILTKPGSLSNNEYQAIKNHPEIGLDILSEFETLGKVRNLVLNHHERSDGSGYPRGILGNQIPLGAQIIAVTDSFDALVSDRGYQRVFSYGEAISELNKCSDRLYDQKVVAPFIGLLEREDFDLNFDHCLEYVSRL